MVSWRKNNRVKKFVGFHIKRDRMPYWVRTEGWISMAGLLEAGRPYLDHIVLEDAMSSREVSVMDGSQKKVMLRGAMNEVLPSHVKACKVKCQRAGNTSERHLRGVVAERCRRIFGRAPAEAAGTGPRRRTNGLCYNPVIEHVTYDDLSMDRLERSISP